MGQTLTHGIYLPDEGERNCYSGLAGNWQILDSAVGTIAEHTQALSGKAPLVHTHVKADITDLFNSANTWSGSQTFTANSIFSNFITAKESAAISAGGYGKGIAFRDYQDNRLGYIQPYLTSDSEKRLLIGADSGDIASNSNIIPNANNSVNLGSSSYQWNNLYAKKVNTQSLNGINPGALSLPDLDNTYRWSLDTTNWVLDGSSHNTFTPLFSGWLNIRIPDAAGNYIIIQSGSITVSNQGTGTLSSAVSRPLSFLIPVVEGVSGTVRVNAASIVGFFYPALGNPIKTVQPSS